MVRLIPSFKTLKNLIQSKSRITKILTKIIFRFRIEDYLVIQILIIFHLIKVKEFNNKISKKL